MKALVSLRIDDALLHSMKQSARLLHLSQTSYMRKAIEQMNHDTARQEQKKRLANASLRVRKQSMHINAEFSEIDHDPNA